MPIEWICIHLFINTVEVGALYYLLCSKFPAGRKSFVPTLCFVVGNVSLLMLSAFGTFGNLPIAEIQLPITTLVYLLVFRNGSVLRKIFWTLISIAIVFALAFIGIAIIAMTIGVGSAATIEANSIELMLTMILTKTSQVVIFYVLAKKRKKSFESVGIQSVAPMLMCLTVPLLSIFLMFFINWLIHNDAQALYKLVFVVSISYLLINIIVFVLYEFISKEAEKNYILMAERKRYELTEQHNAQVMEIYERMREWKHDFKSHMQTVSAMLEKAGPDGNSEAIRYIQGLGDKIESSSLDIATGNLVVDAIVSAKATLASANGIRFEHSILLTRDISACIDSTDLCSILSNLLDNAIEACCKLGEDRHIELGMFVVQNQLVIKTTNATSGEYRMENGKLKTTKSGNLHGIGMGQVRSIAERYGGLFDIEPGARSFAASVSIPLSRNIQASH